jgi:hypothetical protein
MKIHPIFIAAMLILGCASVSLVGAAPAWVTTTPEPDDTYTYFVGSASDQAGDAAKAEEMATNALIGEIMRSIGVVVTSETSATAKSTLDSYQASLTQTVKQSSTNRIAGFEIKEKFSAKDSKTKRTTLYLLARYRTEDLAAEKARIAAVFQEKLDAVARPEAEAKSLLSDGRAFDAVRRFIDAASAAAGSNIDNADVKFARNVNAAKDAVARIGFVKLNDNLSGSANLPFSADFRARVVFGDSASAPGVPGAAVKVGYQAKAANGRLVVKSETVKADDQGIVSFRPPAPNFVGKAALTMSLDLSSALEPLDSAPKQYDDLVSGLEDQIAAKKVSFSYVVGSAAKSAKTAVVLLDVAADGSALATKLASPALLDALAKEGFAVRSPGFDAGAILSGDDAAVLAAARKALAGTADRLAYGTVRLDSIGEDSGMKVAGATASVKVIDIASGAVLYSTTKTGEAVGSDDRAATEAVLRQLAGKTIASDLAASLP